MRLISRTFVAVLMSVTFASSSVIIARFPDRVRRSDAAIVGTLVEVDMVVRNGVVEVQGVIRVKDVIFGSIDPSRDIRLSWQNGVGIACPRVDHERQMGIRMLWLLTEDGDSYRAGIGQAILIGERHGTEHLAEEIANYPGYLNDERLSARSEFLKRNRPVDDIRSR